MKFNALVVISAIVIICCSCASVSNAAPGATDHESKDLKWKSVIAHAIPWKNKFQKLPQGSFSHLPSWSELVTILHKHPDPGIIRNFAEDYITLKLSKYDSSLFQCLYCHMAIKILQGLMNYGFSFESIEEIVAELCYLFKVEKPDVCKGAVNAYKYEVLYVLSHLNDSSVSIDYVCGVIFEDSCFGKPGSVPEWNISLPNIPKPPIIPPKPPDPRSPKLKVLHLTDIHLDPLYQSGSDADCGKPLCCHDDFSSKNPAGYWGDYRTCDIPLRTVESLFWNLSQTSQFDYILWTGDVPSHHIWNQSRAGQLDHLDQLTKLFLKYFPKTPVYCAVGNHESIPVNSFPPPLIKGNWSNSWLYDGLIRNWMNWLPSDTRATISRGGFYSTLIKPGFRIVSLNNNYCMSGNWWLFLNSTDPTDELSWLVEVLQRAEIEGEKVQIIGHIPPGAPECLRTWSWNYYQIVNRYEGVISAQFFGHKHFDLWEVFYDVDFQRPLSVAYVAPSLTTYVHLNPGYRIYEISGFYPNSSWMVLDHETFILNLTESNSKNETIWRKEYSAKEAYGMSGLTPADWNKVTRKLMTDDKMFQMFHKFYYKSSSSYFPECDEKCRKRMVCELRSGLSHDFRPCHDLVGADEKKDLEESFFKWIQTKNLC